MIATALAGLLACVPTEPMCACPPARTHFVVFGEVRQAGAGVGDARLRVTAARPNGASPCDTARGPEELASEVRAGADGRFRADVYSVFGSGLRCLRVAARAGPAGARDSAAIEGLLVRFRHQGERPDSLGLILTLP